MRASRHHLLLAAFVAGALSLPVAAGASTPVASPEAWPQTPDPAACVIAPSSADAILAVLDAAATPAAMLAATPAATPLALTAPGEPADAATTEAVHQTLYQLFACANAGDPLRFASFYTDPFLVEFFGGAPRGDLEAFLATPAQPLPDEERRIIRGIGDVELLADGRARVVIVLDEPSDPRTDEPDTVLLREVDGRWLVDEIHEN